MYNSGAGGIGIEHSSRFRTLFTTHGKGRDKFVRAVLIADEFKGRIWKAKYLDNESRGSVAVSSKLLYIQSYDKTNELSKNSYLSILKHRKTPTFNQKGHKRSFENILTFLIDRLFSGLHSFFRASDFCSNIWLHWTIGLYNVYFIV